MIAPAQTDIQTHTQHEQRFPWQPPGLLLLNRRSLMTQRVEVDLFLCTHLFFCLCNLTSRTKFQKTEFGCQLQGGLNCGIWTISFLQKSECLNSRKVTLSNHFWPKQQAIKRAFSQKDKDSVLVYVCVHTCVLFL